MTRQWPALLLASVLLARVLLTGGDAAAESFLDRWNDSLGDKAPPAPASVPETAAGPALSPKVERPGPEILATPLPLRRSEAVGPAAGEPDRGLVAEVQRLLATLGYVPGSVDGVFGQRTRAAIAGFLAEAGAPPGLPLSAVRERLYTELSLRAAGKR